MTDWSVSVKRKFRVHYGAHCPRAHIIQAAALLLALADIPSQIKLGAFPGSFDTALQPYAATQGMTKISAMNRKEAEKAAAPSP